MVIAFARVYNNKTFLKTNGGGTSPPPFYIFLMKLSKYAYFLEFGDDVLCCNLISKVIFVIDREKYDLLMQYAEQEERLGDVKPNLHSALVKLCIIVADDADEMATIRYMYCSDVFDSKTYRLTLMPTMGCNFRCWYCYETRPHEAQIMSAEIQNSVVRHIERQIEYNGIKMLVLDWFGGEPWLCFDTVMYPLSKRLMHLADKHGVEFQHQITTNGYLIRTEHIEKIAELRFRSFQITLDGNRHFHQQVKKSADAYQRTVDNVIALCGIDGVNVGLRINFSDKNLEGITDIIDDFPPATRKRISISFQRIWRFKDLNTSYKALLQPINQQFEDAGFHIDGFDMPRVQSCYADREQQLVVAPDGLVFKCTARDFNEQNCEGRLLSDGSVEWNQDKLHRRMGHFRFDNKKCFECNLLPACFGPCSQKVLETAATDLKKICNYKGLKLSIDEFLTKQYHEKFGKTVCV